MSKISETVLKSIVKWILVIAIVATLFQFFQNKTTLMKNTREYTAVLQREELREPVLQCREIQNVIKIRNQLSAELNKARKQIGQMQCEKSKGRTSEQGGWCKTVSREDSGQHATDIKLIPVLSEFLKNKIVASFGDGPGAYKRKLDKLGHVKSYSAYDGAPYTEETSEGKVMFMDLTVPQYGIPVYDWIISLEVAEHIPEKYEAVYLDNIFRHSREGIILSWAVPGQGGLSHINNKPLEYVVNVMKNNGFNRNETLSKKFQNAAGLPWIKKNINVYVRQTNPQDDRLSNNSCNI